MIVELEKLTVTCLLERTFELYGSLPSIATVDEQPAKMEGMDHSTLKFICDLETMVFEDNGRLLVKAYLDYDVLDREFERNKLNDAEARTLTEEILEQARLRINTQLPAFSQINKILEHPEPFEKTPTNKVKRYLFLTPRSNSDGE